MIGRRSGSSPLVAVLVLLAASAGGLGAQEAEAERHGGHAMDAAGMGHHAGGDHAAGPSRCEAVAQHGPYLPTPAMLVRHRGEFGLTDAQVTRLEAMPAASGPRMGDRLHERMRAVHERIERALGADEFDEAGVRTALQEMHGLCVDAAIDRLRERHALLGLLTPDQLRAIAEHREGMADHGDGMMHERDVRHDGTHDGDEAGESGHGRGIGTS